MGLLRFLLALSVIANHFGALWKFDFVGGVAAVQTFYIISGFYMSLVLNEKYIGENSSYKLFLTNRLLKIYPLYWVVLVFCIVSNFFMFDYEGLSFHYLSEVDLNFFSYVYLILSHIWVFGQDIVMFMAVNVDTGALYFTENFNAEPMSFHHFLFVPAAWSLSIELMFYVLAPFIVRRNIRIIVILILALLLLRILTFNTLKLTNDPWTYRFFPLELMFFLCGTISYHLYKGIRNIKTIPKIVNYFALLFVVFITVVFFKIPEMSITYFPFSLRQVAYYTIIILSIPFIFVLTKQSVADRIIGELSYPMYLSHLIIGILCQYYFKEQFLTSSLFIGLLTIVVSFLLVKYIINPIENFRHTRIK